MDVRTNKLKSNNSLKSRKLKIQTTLKPGVIRGASEDQVDPALHAVPIIYVNIVYSESFVYHRRFLFMFDVVSIFAITFLITQCIFLSSYIKELLMKTGFTCNFYCLP